MIYMVWFNGDDPQQFDWYMVFGTKTAAMKYARHHATENNKQVEYLTYENPTGKDRFDYCASKYVIVCQEIYYYHGA